MRALWRGLAVLLVAALPARAQGVLAAFTVLGPQGAVARAVVDGPTCPPLEIDGSARTMQVRKAADNLFPLVCEAPLPAGAAKARIAGTDVPTLRPEQRRIALFGDSGCRIDASEVQACNNTAHWPFARTSAAAASLAPDLVIHVGDYLYRETPCPPGDADCRGSPSGYGWPAWQADFFAPAAPLLKTAPWVMVRGNHEDCHRAWIGFFRLLDPRPLPAACPDTSDAYQVAAPPLNLVVIDSASAPDDHASPGIAAEYQREFAAMNPPAGSWLLTHRPPWAVVRVRVAGVSVLIDDNVTLQQGARPRFPAGIALAISGHIHLFEALSFADKRPPQLVFGTAGSSLSDAIDTDLAGHGIDGTTIVYGRTLKAFGVSTMERAGDGWAATLRDEQGAPRFVCTIAGPEVACRP